MNKFEKRFRDAVESVSKKIPGVVLVRLYDRSDIWTRGDCKKCSITIPHQVCDFILVTPSRNYFVELKTAQDNRLYFSSFRKKQLDFLLKWSCPAVPYVVVIKCNDGYCCVPWVDVQSLYEKKAKSIACLDYEIYPSLIDLVKELVNGTAIAR